MPSSSAKSGEEELISGSDISPDSVEKLSGALRQSERDLAALQGEKAWAEAEAARLSGELGLLHQNLRALERKLERHEQIREIRDAELVDMRALLGEMARAADDLRIVRDEEQKTNGALRRRVAELVPEAASNTMAMRLLRDLRAELSALREKQDVNQARHPAGPLRRISGLAQRLMTGG